MEFLLPAMLLEPASASGADADVAAACQTLGGISLHSESGKQAEKQRASEREKERAREDRNNFFLASLSSSLLFPLSPIWLFGSI